MLPMVSNAPRQAACRLCMCMLAASHKALQLEQRQQECVSSHLVGAGRGWWAWLTRRM